jgi:murein DD-endopeptidase MepM/ murein hydrolase activator NlpD
LSRRNLICSSILAALVPLSGCRSTERPTTPPHRAFDDIRLPLEFQTVTSEVPSRATLDSLLRGNHLQDSLIARAVDAARAVFNPRQLKAGRSYRLVRTMDGLLREFEYQIDADRFLRIFSPDRTHPEALDARVLPYEKETDTVGVDARIDEDHPSLIAAIDDAGERVQLAMALAEIFSGEVDFQSDLQPGDSFRVLFEKSSHDGEFSSYGSILSASIDVDGRTRQAFRWQDARTGRAGYYDEHGRSLKRFMLRSPLKFEPRVTSGFSLDRIHPIDHVARAHLGVDYAAPVGAAVVAVATGTVLSAGYSGASGNMVHLKHASGVETYYLHLSAFGKGIRPGAHVEQGQTIGRVGATGAATGPHLDYRLKRNGVFVNPLVVHARQAPGEPIPESELGAFSAAREDLASRLAAALQDDDALAKPDAVKAAKPVQ